MPGMDDDETKLYNPNPPLALARGIAPTWPWPGIVAALSVVGLLVALVEVVQLGVHDSGMRRAAAARHDDAAWRCNALHGRVPRDNCLLEIDAAQPRAGMAVLVLDAH
jgi:hypothetical protein